MPLVNTTHFRAITLKAQTHLQPLHQGKWGFGIVPTIIACVVEVTKAAGVLSQRATMQEIVIALVSKSTEGLQ